MKRSKIAIQLSLLLVALLFSGVQSFADKQVQLTNEQMRQLDKNLADLKEASARLKSARQSLEKAKTQMNSINSTTSTMTSDSAVYARQRLPEMEKRLGRNNPQVLTLYNTIALDYLLKKQYAQAEYIYTWLLPAREKVSGSNSKETADILVNFADAKRGQGNYHAAIPLYERGAKILENVHGILPSCDLVQQDRAYMGLAESYDKLGQKTQADKWRAVDKEAYKAAGYGK